jgi:plasmid stabilization system protein ParE
VPDSPAGTIPDQINALRTEVAQLVDQGELARVRGALLTVTLNLAERRYDLGYYRLARRDMRVFVGLVNLWESRSRISPEAADSLRAQAEAIIAAIELESNL